MNRYLCIWDYLFTETIVKIVKSDCDIKAINNIEKETGLAVDKEDVVIVDITNIDLNNLEIIK